MVSLSLQNGAQPNMDDRRGLKPIHEAAKRNYSDIVDLLLKAGVDPLTPKARENHGGRLSSGEISTKGETAVQYVYEKKHTESLIKMIPYLDLHALGQVICECARYGKHEALRAVLYNSKVSTDAKFDGATALYLAVRSVNLKCVEILLARGADVNIVSDWKPRNKRRGPGPLRDNARLPIHAVAAKWPSQDTSGVPQAILRLLLEHGADLESQVGDGETPLLNIFSQQGSKDIQAIQALLSAGANVSATSRDGDTALHRSLKTSRNLEIVRLLLDYGAIIDARGSEGFTALHLAVSSSSAYDKKSSSVKELVELLSSRGALCTILNDRGKSALDYGISQRECHISTIRVLLAQCPDASARQRCLWSLTPYNSRSTEATIGIIQCLQSFGVDLEARDQTRRTILLASVGSTSTFDALLHCGSVLNVVDCKGRGVLHVFVSKSTGRSLLDNVRILVGLGLDPLCVDDQGDNLLHEAARLGFHNEELVNQLLRWGISINSKNTLGQTALHIYLEYSEISSTWTTDYQPTLESILTIFQKEKVLM